MPRAIGRAVGNAQSQAEPWLSSDRQGADYWGYDHGRGVEPGLYRVCPRSAHVELPEKTRDGGQTWTSINNYRPLLEATPVGQYVATSAVATDPHTPDTLYASTLGHGSCCPAMGGGGFS